jgi:hypothetical protein
VVAHWAKFQHGNTTKPPRILDSGRVFIETPRLMADTELADVLAAFVAEVRAASCESCWTFLAGCFFSVLGRTKEFRCGLLLIIANQTLIDDHMRRSS